MTLSQPIAASGSVIDVIPKHTTCPFCGKELRTTSVSFSIRGKRKTRSGLPVFGSCGCKRSRETLELRRELTEQEWRQRFVECGIPRDYLYIDPPCGDVVSAVNAGESVYIYGHTNGVGKTAKACAAAKRLIRNGKRTQFVSVTKLESDYRDTFGANLEPLLHAPVLVLDDVGKESGTSFTASMVYTIVNDRAANNYPTIYTSNKDIAELGEQLGDTDTGRAVTSRLAMCSMVHVTGQDRRLA